MARLESCALPVRGHRENIESCEDNNEIRL